MRPMLTQPAAPASRIAPAASGTTAFRPHWPRPRRAVRRGPFRWGRPVGFLLALGLGGPGRRRAAYSWPRVGGELWRPRGSGVIAVEAVVAAGRLQARRERERLAGLGVAAEQLQAAAEAEQGVVVRRRAVDDRLELGGRLLVALRVKQGSTERLADRRLVGRKVARTRERDRRLVVVTGLEQLGPAPEQLVNVVHHRECKPRADARRASVQRGGSAHNARSQPTGPRPAAQLAAQGPPLRLRRLPRAAAEAHQPDRADVAAASGESRKRCSSAASVSPPRGGRPLRASARSSSATSSSARGSPNRAVRAQQRADQRERHEDHDRDQHRRGAAAMPGCRGRGARRRLLGLADRARPASRPWRTPSGPAAARRGRRGPARRRASDRSGPSRSAGTTPRPRRAHRCR